MTTESNSKMSLRSTLLVIALTLGVVALVVMYVPSFRMAVVSAFTGEPHYDNKFASTWVEELKSPSPRIRTLAAEGLQQIIPTSDKITAALTVALEDNTEDVRIASAEALGNVGQQDGPEVAGLTKALDDPSPLVRATAAHALASCGASDPKVVAALTETLNDRDRTVRAAAAEALAGLDTEALPLLIESLNGHNIRVRREAVYALGLMGSSAEEAMPKILSLMTDGLHPSVRRAAAVAAVEINPENKDLKPALLKALEDKDVLVRVSAVESLEVMEDHGDDVIAKFIEIMKNKDADSMVRESVAHALGTLGPNAKSAIPALTELDEDEDPDIKQAAAEALDSINAVASKDD